MFAIRLPSFNESHVLEDRPQRLSSVRMTHYDEACDLTLEEWEDLTTNKFYYVVSRHTDAEVRGTTYDDYYTAQAALLQLHSEVTNGYSNV